jgi:beta-glucosidase
LYCLSAFSVSAQKTSAQSPYHREIQATIRSLTLKEKVGQMTQLNLDVVSVGEIYKLKEPHTLDTVKLKEALHSRKVGSILNCGGHAYSLEHWRSIQSTLNKLAQQAPGSFIPLIYGIDAIHGANYLHEGLLFPQPLAQAASFDSALVRRVAMAAAYQTAASGIPWNFSPVLDVARHPLWSRFFETYGEDPHLVSELGAACISGYQGTHPSRPTQVAATMKHFLGYGMPHTGKDRTPTYIHPRQLRELILPPFEAGIRAGALSVMVNSGELNGIPVHADPEILTNLLRKELGFQGLVVSDWEDIEKLVTVHRVAANYKEATRMAVMAGVDLAMVPNDYRFTDALIELAETGEVPMKRIDEAVYRILHVKHSLGLFNRQLPEPISQFPLMQTDTFHHLNMESARSSWILLKNRRQVLPLAKGSSVVLAGQALDEPFCWNGAWSRTWQGVDPRWDTMNAGISLIEAIQEYFQLGLTIPAPRVFSSDARVEANALQSMRTDAEQAPLIAVVAEKPSTEKPGDIEQLSLPADEIAWIRRLCAAHAGPKILVLVQNRPRIISSIDSLFDAILLSNQPGSAGTRSLAELLSGGYSPSGRLPYTYPAREHSLMTYDHKHTERLHTDFSMNAFQPAYAFGHGLGYAPIRYESLELLQPLPARATDSLRLRVRLRNEGVYTQKETVMAFVSDSVASITPPAKRLRAIKAVVLQSGASTEVDLVFPISSLGFVGRDLKHTLEPGWFTLQVGPLQTRWEWIP